MSQRVLAIFFTVLLALPAPGWCQAAAPAGGRLKIIVVRGDNAVNSISKNAAPVVVEVRDDAEKVIAGAEVVFQLPTMGPGGTFYGWMRTYTTRTDQQGRAASAPFTPTGEEGFFEIVVTASAAGQHGSVRVAQSNSRTGAAPEARKSHKAVWIVLGVVAAGAIGGGIAASKRGDSNGTAVVTIPVTVSPGVVTVGGPR